MMGFLKKYLCLGFSIEKTDEKKFIFLQINIFFAIQSEVNIFVILFTFYFTDSMMQPLNIHIALKRSLLIGKYKAVFKHLLEFFACFQVLILV